MCDEVWKDEGSKNGFLTGVYMARVKREELRILHLRAEMYDEICCNNSTFHPKFYSYNRSGTGSKEPSDFFNVIDI